jgi:hypothetical protein
MGVGALRRPAGNGTADAIVDSSMDVYLVPLGAARHELYCEVGEPPVDADEEPVHTGVVRRFVRSLRRQFREMLAEAERLRRRPDAVRVERGWMGRLRVRVLRWAAESIAEQRLLWHLRKHAELQLFYPDDLDETRAGDLLRTQLGRDFEKHRFWLAIDSVGFVVSGLLMLIPGPNLVAYYFAFRLVGHYLSLRGARHGLDVVTWRFVPSPPLSELRRAVDLEPTTRGERVRTVAATLRLEHLVTFFERTAVPTP